jgi:hypothetical protein
MENNGPSGRPRWRDHCTPRSEHTEWTLPFDPRWRYSSNTPATDDEPIGPTRSGACRFAEQGDSQAATRDNRRIQALAAMAAWAPWLDAEVQPSSSGPTNQWLAVPLSARHGSVDNVGHFLGRSPKAAEQRQDQSKVRAAARYPYSVISSRKVCLPRRLQRGTWWLFRSVATDRAHPGDSVSISPRAIHQNSRRRRRPSRMA